MTTTVLGWPTRPDVPNEETTAGIIVAVRSAQVTGDSDIVIYGFQLPNGSQVFGRVAIDPEGAHPAYAWFSLSGGQDIRVAYNSEQPEQSVPYRTFPLWTTISWATIFATGAYILVMLVMNRWARLAALRETALRAP